MAGLIGSRKALLIPDASLIPGPLVGGWTICCFSA
jgi:hypothetical protein